MSCEICAAVSPSQFDGAGDGTPAGAVLASRLLPTESVPPQNRCPEKRGRLTGKHDELLAHPRKRESFSRQRRRPPVDTVTQI